MTVPEIRKALKNYALLNIDWICSIGSYFLQKRKVVASTYCYLLGQPQFPIDILGLTIFARMQNIQIAIIQKHYVWTTGTTDDISVCSIILGFGGLLTTKDEVEYPVLFDTMFKPYVPPKKPPTDPAIVQEVAEFLSLLAAQHEEETSSVQSDTTQIMLREYGDTVSQTGDISDAVIESPPGFDIDSISIPRYSPLPLVGELPAEIMEGDQSGHDLRSESETQGESLVQSGIDGAPTSLQSGNGIAVQSGIDIPVQSGNEDASLEVSSVPLRCENETEGESLVQSGTSTVQSGTDGAPTSLQSGNGIAVQSGIDIPVQSGNEDASLEVSSVPLRCENETEGESLVQSGTSTVQSGTDGASTSVQSGSNGILIPTGNNDGDDTDTASESLLANYTGNLQSPKHDDGVVNGQTRKGRQTRNSIAAGLADPLSPRAKRKRPDNLVEKDPIGEAIQGLSPLQSNAEDSEDEEGKTTPPPAQKIKTEAGQLKITAHRIRRSKKKIVNLKCLVKTCAERSTSEAERNMHMITKHPDYKFICEHCNKKFKTKNGLWKHEHKHFAPKFPCTWEGCNHKCFYKSDLEAHLKTHTLTGLIQCTWKGCKSMFVSNKNMYAHLESHTETTYKCDECDHSPFATKYLYNQHMRGQHPDSDGESYLKAKCGARFKWPTERSKHQATCDACQKYFHDLEQRPEKTKKETCTHKS